MTTKQTIDAFIISWTGKEENARKIAAEVVDKVDRLFVIYSNATNTPTDGAGEWVQVPDAWFYGKKFEACLQRLSGDLMLQIQADASCDDWGRLIERCRTCFREREQLAVWAPEVDYTPYPLSRVKIIEAGPAELVHVAQTDGIVWTLSRDVCERLRDYDYDVNHFGWGMDWASVCYAYANDREVLVDAAIHVDHPKTRGYKGDDARRQMHLFLEQMTGRERMFMNLMVGFMAPKEKPRPTFLQNVADLLPSLARGFRNWRRARRARRKARAAAAVST